MEGSEEGQSQTDTQIELASDAPSEVHHEKLERKSSKLRLSKQAEVEVVEEFEHSSSVKGTTSQTEDENSPNSDGSDRTVVDTAVNAAG